MNILIDLDGTLLDARARLHGLFCELVPGCELTRDEYWRLKRAALSHDQILRELFGYSVKAIDQFRTAWLARIESEEFLALDVPFDGVTEHLRHLSRSHHLYLLTSRQNSARVACQLHELGWTNLFIDVLVTGPQRQKHESLGRLTLSDHDWIIGDTGRDVETGKLLGLCTAAVAGGFLSRDVLLQYEPDLLVERFVDFEPGEGAVELD